MWVGRSWFKTYVNGMTSFPSCKYISLGEKLGLLSMNVLFRTMWKLTLVVEMYLHICTMSQEKGLGLVNKLQPWWFQTTPSEFMAFPSCN